MAGEENDSRELIPGDLLWTKIGKYPFWPCMISYDPSSGDYYRQIKSKEKIYIVYHVQYFGTKPLRGWTSRKKTLLYEGRQKFLCRMYDVSEKNKYAQSLYNVPQCYKRDWEIAITEAEEAFKITDVKERFANFVFSYENVKKKSLKTMHETSLTDVVENSQEVEQDRKKKKMKSAFKKENVKGHTRIVEKKNLERTSCDLLKILNNNLTVRIEKLPSCPLALQAFISKQCRNINNGSNINVQNDEDKSASNNKELQIERCFSSKIQDSSSMTSQDRASDKALDNEKTASNNDGSCILENVSSSDSQDSSCNSSQDMASDKADNDKSAPNNVHYVPSECFPSKIMINQFTKFKKCLDNRLCFLSNTLELNVIRNVQNRNNYHNLHTCRKYNSGQAPASNWSNYRPPGDSCGTDDDTEEEEDDDNSPATLPGHIVSFSKNYIYKYPVFHRCEEYNTKKGCRCLTCAVCNSENNIVLFCWTCPSSFCNDCRRNYAPLLFFMEDAPFLQRFIFYCQICAIKRCQNFIYRK